MKCCRVMDPQLLHIRAFQWLNHIDTIDLSHDVKPHSLPSSLSAASRSLTLIQPHDMCDDHRRFYNSKTYDALADSAVFGLWARSKGNAARSANTKKPQNTQKPTLVE